MFDMIQEGNILSFRNIEILNEHIKAPGTDIFAIKESMNKNYMTEQEFIDIFSKKTKNKFFSWIEDLAKPYKMLEELEENTKISAEIKRLESKTELPLELKRFTEEKKYRSDFVYKFQLAYKNLEGMKRLNTRHLAEIISNYGIKNPLASKLVSNCVIKDKCILQNFIEIFYILTQSDCKEAFINLLFTLYAQKIEQSISV